MERASRSRHRTARVAKQTIQLRATRLGQEALGEVALAGGPLSSPFWELGRRLNVSRSGGYDDKNCEMPWRRKGTWRLPSGGSVALCVRGWGEATGAGQ